MGSRGTGMRIDRADLAWVFISVALQCRSTFIFMSSTNLNAVAVGVSCCHCRSIRGGYSSAAGETHPARVLPPIRPKLPLGQHLDNHTNSALETPKIMHLWRIFPPGAACKPLRNREAAEVE